MILDAPTSESWEHCRRAWSWSQDWELKRITPLGSLYRTIDRYLTADYAEPADARSWIMTEAGERGVWTLRHDPYEQIVNHAHMAECLVRVLRQPNSPAIQKHGAVQVGPHQWQPQSYMIDNGLRLMRVILADHWDDDRQLAELHSWRTVGDVSSTGLPMTLRILVIGHSRDGRRHSFWTKGQQHPVNKQLRFQRKHGKADGLAASWNTVWREESGISAQAWLEQMSRDGVLRELAFDRQVKVPPKFQRDRVLQDILRIVGEMDSVRGQYPMTRSACDDPIRGSCPYECCCYSPGENEITPGDTGVFRRRHEKANNDPKG